MNLDVMGHGWQFSQCRVLRWSVYFPVYKKQSVHSFLALVSLEDLAVQIYHEDGFQLIWILLKWIFLGKSTPTEKLLGMKRLFC